ncbi:hypothetical protein IKQ21_09695 [bacterium]|jgi:hypothetical protein|nr:hypothetical protein [bacterium]
MNPEKLQFKGMLAEAKKSFRTKNTEASGLVILIRSLLNPYEDISKLDVEKALISMQRLQEIQEDIKALDTKIKNLESELE